MNTVKQTPEIRYTDIENEYREFILTQKHPCVMAKTLFMLNDYHLHIYDDMQDTICIKNILTDLERFINQYDFDSNTFESFIAVFPNNKFNSEYEFETALWHTLQELHNLDDSEWDPTVSDNPNDSKFSFSLKGRAFYIVGLHPNSSRLARQSPYTTIVFNLHWQFEKLREMKTYKKVKKRIRKRDKQLQGTINPTLKDFGNDTETKQYSGRQVDKDWKCPFHKKQN
ncbi:YqcI/YcgG family protein [Formosa sediminum]|uniref:YqcI/YcgG family protein n=1 Tax=Formosa sediminum TaxID=2594004 RepID=A0A516GM47_9FLAO|nr:guanitoxin biosynthesis heme-dependent pre-guanitoxin N-hydroxylase GntA [Formosa sediminum]QDO92593.1 YqcI/YcgG family protein [Formosa sediminum]